MNPLCIVGSIGDVAKIHGKAVGDKTHRAMEELNAPYHYFKGDDPDTWLDMIAIWNNYTAPYRKPR